MKNNVILAILGIVFLVFPLVVKSDYYQHLVIIALMWVVIGSSWNLLAGYTGQVSFGHAIFFGVGAYTAGILFSKLGISPWWGMLAGGISSMLIGLFVGWVCFRLRGPYFALATLAGGEIFRLIATNWESLTEGMVGILIIPSFESKLPYYYIALLLAAGCIFAIHIIMQPSGDIILFPFAKIRMRLNHWESTPRFTKMYHCWSVRCLPAWPALFT